MKKRPEIHWIVAGLFDNEEIGSRSKQGADSSLLKDIIMKIGAAFGGRNRGK